jgi:hypothetical protein
MNDADFDLLDRMANMETRLRALQAELERVVIDNHFLREENEACARLWQKDAYRYRFLRDRAWPFEFKGNSAEDADAAIDAAIDLARGEV